MNNVDCTGRKVSQTADTQTQYASKGRLLVAQAGRSGRRNTLADCVDWFVGSHEKWAASTIRFYRAALRFAVEVSREVGKLDGEQVDRLLGVLVVGPRAKVGGAKQTAAAKRKSMPEAQFNQLLSALAGHNTADALLLRRLLAFNVVLFLRPVEFMGAHVVGDRLIIHSAKTTNGRGLGPEREREIENLSPAQRRALQQLLADLGGAADEAGGHGKLFERLSSLLARICKKHRIPRVCLYTTRHIGIATAKRRMPADQVAAAAGHRSTRTATSLYAKRRTGWRNTAMPRLRPAETTLARVRWSPKTSRDENMASSLNKFPATGRR